MTKRMPPKIKQSVVIETITTTDLTAQQIVDLMVKTGMKIPGHSFEVSMLASENDLPGMDDPVVRIKWKFTEESEKEV